MSRCRVGLMQRDAERQAPLQLSDIRMEEGYPIRTSCIPVSIFWHSGSYASGIWHLASTVFSSARKQAALANRQASKPVGYQVPGLQKNQQPKLYILQYEDSTASTADKYHSLLLPHPRYRTHIPATVQ